MTRNEAHEAQPKSEARSEAQIEAQVRYKSDFVPCPAHMNNGRKRSSPAPPTFNSKAQPKSETQRHKDTKRVSPGLVGLGLSPAH